MGKELHIDTSMVDQAIVFATEAHSGAERRGKGFPYIIHPLEAMSIVATITTDSELLAAAALHDVIEDTEYTYEDIASRFGERIAKLVSSETDVQFPEMSESESWRMRKEIAMQHLKNADLDTKIVAIGDKLSNMRAMARDYREIGDELWNRFHVTEKSEHSWRYHGLVDAFSGLEDTEPYREFKKLVNEVFGE